MIDNLHDVYRNNEKRMKRHQIGSDNNSDLSQEMKMWFYFNNMELKLE